jgi:hypothetical protein
MAIQNFFRLINNLEKDFAAAFYFSEAPSLAVSVKALQYMVSITTQYSPSPPHTTVQYPYIHSRQSVELERMPLNTSWNKFQLMKM